MIYSLAKYKYSAQTAILVGFLVKFTEADIVLYKLIIGRRGLKMSLLASLWYYPQTFSECLQM